MRKLSPLYRFSIFVLSTLSVVAAVAVIRFGFAKASSEKKPAPPAVEREFFPTPQAAVAGKATVRATIRAASGIRLSGGGDLQAIYSGDANAISALNSGPVQSLSLASDDLNNDGAPDVIAGYSANGRGVIAMYKGNIDAFAPTSAAVYQAVQSGRIPASFDSTVQVLDVPEPPDFIVTGDFNHDGKRDILTGARGGGLYLITGDGQGKFDAASSISLPGQVTGLAAGEFNKADGQPDVAVGINSENGPAVLVFDNRSGGITGRPAKYNLSSAATALAFDTLDNDQYSDLAIAAGNEVVILHGQSAQTEHINVGFNIQSLTLGEFIWNRGGKKSMALLGDDGAIHLLEGSDLDTRPFTGGEAAERKINAIKNADQPTTPRAGITHAAQSTTKGEVNVQWSLTTQLPSGNNAAAKQTLMSSQISAGELSDLLVIDQTGNKINLMRPSGDQQNRTNTTSADNSAITMSVDGSPSAVLAMPKKVNGQRDLVVLRAGQVTPSMMTATGQTTITVNRTDDIHASVCAGGANDCSLRGAIDFANAHPGTTINLPAGTYDLTAASTFENSNANGDLDINASGTTIVGASAGSTIIRQTATDRVFNVNFASSANFSFNLSGVTVQGGNDRSDLGGGGIFLGGPSNDYSITNCTFDSNTASNTAGGAISLALGGNLSLMSNTFTNNGAGATRGGAISLGDGNVVAHFNRFVNNVAASAVYGNDVYASAGIGDFTNNWWANIGGPKAGDAVGKGGLLTTTPSLTLVLKTEKSSVAANSPATITASFRNGTNGDPINTSNLGALIGLPITFGAKAGTVNDSDVNIQGSATASASVTLANSDVATATVDGATASITISAVPPPTFSIAFGAASIPVNGKTSLTFTISNPGNALHNVSFTDTLPSGMVVANPANYHDNGACFSVTTNATAGSNSANTTIGTVPGNADCSFSVDVTSTTNGIKTNTTGAITSDESGPGGTATATLNVDAPPVLSLSFSQPSVRTTQPSGLQITIANPGTNPDTLTNVSFTAHVPTGLHVNNASQSPICPGGSGTVTLTNPDTISLTGGSIAPNTSCQFTITIRTDARGQYTISGNVSSDNGGTGNTDSANLTVSDAPTVTSSFSSPTVPLGGVTTLTLNITNPNTTSLSSLAFTDTLPSGLQVAATPTLTNTCGGTATATANSGTVKLTNGGLAGGASCSISVAIQGTTAGIKNNSVQVNSSEGGPSNTSNTSITVVAPPVIIKAFGAASIFIGGFTSLTFTIQNNNAGANLTGIGFTDNLPAGLVVSTPNGLVGSCGGGTITAVAGSGSVALSGSTIAQSAQCQFSINVTGTTAGVKNNTTSQVTATESGNGGTASASVTVNTPNPPVIIKAFGAASIFVGGSTSLTFTIQNNNAGANLTGIGFTDNLPAGLVVSTPNGLVGSCGGGTITAVAGSGSVSLSGAAIAQSAQCQFSINVTGTTAGVKNNTTSQVTATESGNGGTASASVTVNTPNPPVIIKAFGAASIFVGGSTSLTFTIQNNNASANLTGIGFTDNLPAGLVVATPNGLAGSCGGGTITAVAGSGSVSLSGSTIPQSAQCQFSINVKGTTAGVKNNTTSQVTATESGNGGTASASVTVVAPNPPVIIKAFGAATIPAGGSTSLTFTIQNNNASANLTGIGFTDNLPAGLVVSTPNGLVGSCGGGTITAVAGSGSVSLTGASIAQSAQCQFSINVTGTTPGVKNNTTGQVTAAESGNGGTASASVTVNAPNPPVIIKAFGAATIPIGGSTSLTFTIQNNNASANLTGVGFTDNLPLGLAVSTPNGLAGSCGGGTITAVAGSGSVSLSGATLAQNTQCQFSINVKGTTAGVKNNTTGQVTATESGNGGTASASVTVFTPNPPVIIKAFGAASIQLNGSTSLTFTIQNNNAAANLTGIGFTDNLPAGLVVSSPNGLAGSCGGGTITAVAGSGAVSLSGAAIAQSAQCQFSVNVTGTTAGVKNNTTSQVTATESGNGGTASASVTVAAAPSIAKAFGAGTIALNGTTSLTVTITNPNSSLALNGVAFTDNLPAGLVVATPNALNNTCGGSATATAGSSSVTLSAGTIASNSSCTVTVNVTANSSGSKVNTTSNVSSTNGGTGNIATATLTVASAPTITKAFGAASIPLNGTTSLTFNINNPNIGLTLTGIAFTDNLPAGLVVATPNALSNTCGGTAIATAGSGFVSLSGASLTSNTSCSVSINVQGTVAGVKNNSTQITSIEGGTGNTTNASITVVAPPVNIKVFGAASIPLNGTTSLQFTVQNNNTTTILTGVGFSDVLPAGLQIATPNGLTGSCGGGTISAPSLSGSIALTGATLAPNTSCTFSINVIGTTAGTKNNVSGNANSNEGGMGGTASASINVVAPPSIAKAFGVATIALNGTTNLTFTITNPAANAIAETGVAFTDTLPAGLVVATPNALTNTCGGTVTATAGSNSISLSGGNIAVSSTCTVSVNVTVTASGQFTNVTGNVSSTNGGTGNTATANITVASPPTIVKSFGVASMPVNQTTSLSFTISNPNSGLALTGISFTDFLPAGMLVASPNGLTGSCGGGVISATAGAGAVTLNGATLPANATCSFSMNVTAGSTGIKNNTTGNVTSNESGPGGTASASITIAPRTTTTSVTFSINPIVFGQSTQVTATVVDIDAGVKSNPSGLVSFTAGGDILTPTFCVLNPLAGTTDTSTCQVNLRSLATGMQAVDGSYGGSASTHAPSNGSSQLTVNKANSSSLLLSLINPSVFGQSVTFMVTVSAVAPGAGVPTNGVFTFLDNGNVIGVSVPNGSGVATLTVSNLSVATHPITTSYTGDGSFNDSTSNVVNQVVNQASTTTALTSSVNPSSFGQSVTFTATVAAIAPGAGTPTGTVTFTDGATILGTRPVLLPGVATFSIATLSVATHPITATYSGDVSFTGSASAALNQVVTKSPTATALTSSLNPSVFGQPVTFTATVTSIGPPVNNPGSSTRGRTRTVQSRTQANRAAPSAFGIGIPSGTVTFFDAATQIGTGTLNGSGVATFTTAALSAGVHSITASYGGDASFLSSTSPALIQTVNKANTASVAVSSVNPSVFGQPVTITVTVTAVAPGAGTPSGSVIIFGLLPPGVFPISIPLNGSGVATQTFPNLAVGTYNVTANYSGDDNFNFSRSNLVNQVVNKDNSVTTVTASSNPAFVSTTVTFTATVTAAAPGAGIPTGLLQFKDNGVNIGAPVVLVNGVASVTESNLTAGNHAITAIYSGDGNFNASTGTLAGGLNVGFKFVDTVSGNTLIVVPPANGQTGNGTWTWISNGTTIAANIPAVIELNPTILRIRSTSPSMEATFDATVPLGQAILFDRTRNQSFEINITSFALK